MVVSGPSPGHYAKPLSQNISFLACHHQPSAVAVTLLRICSSNQPPPPSAHPRACTASSCVSSFCRPTASPRRTLPPSAGGSARGCAGNARVRASGAARVHQGCGQAIPFHAIPFPRAAAERGRSSAHACLLPAQQHCDSFRFRRHSRRWPQEQRRVERGAWRVARGACRCVTRGCA